MCIRVPLCRSLKENTGLLLNDLLQRGFSEEHTGSDVMPVATAAPDAFRSDTITPEPEDLDTVSQNSAALSTLQPHSLAPGSGSPDPLEEELRSRLSKLVSRANSKDSSSSEEERPADKQTDKENDRQIENTKPKDSDREKQRARGRLRDRACSKERQKGSDIAEKVNGQEMTRSERLIKSPSPSDEDRLGESSLEKGEECFEDIVHVQEPKRGDRRQGHRHSRRQHKRDLEKEAEPPGAGWRSGSSASSPAVTPSSQGGVLSDNPVRR